MREIDEYNSIINLRLSDLPKALLLRKEVLDNESPVAKDRIGSFLGGT